MLVERTEQLHGLAHRQFFRQTSFLQRDTQRFPQLALMRLPRASKNFDFAGSRFQQAFQDFDGRGFACAVGTEQAKALARLDGQIQAADGFYFPFIGLAQVSTLNSYSHLPMINGWKDVGVRARNVVGPAWNGSQDGTEIGWSTSNLRLRTRPLHIGFKSCSIVGISSETVG